MYSVYISDGYRGSFSTLGEAMKMVQQNAFPYGSKWMVKDPYQKVCAQG